MKGIVFWIIIDFSSSLQSILYVYTEASFDVVREKLVLSEQNCNVVQSDE